MPRGETTRSKIEKVNATIASLHKEMRDEYDTDQFIDWGDLINRLKMYRSDLEDELTEEENEPLPQADSDTTPPPHWDYDSAATTDAPTPSDDWTNDWNAAMEQKFLDNPDVYRREDMKDLESHGFIHDDDEDYIDAPSDDELLNDEDDD